MSTRLGNFYSLFPSGFYRQTTPINYAAGDSFRKEVMQTIDELIKEKKFDLARYERILRIGQQSVQRGFALLSHGATLATAKHHLSRGDTFARLRDDMIAPHYEKLVSLGYDEERLKR